MTTLPRKSFTLPLY
uniref:Uncharacterized protein n=1 Tax=Anguilla anguilla TaxID=7936 RepID=A0A0E9QPK4_ANGAN